MSWKQPIPVEVPQLVGDEFALTVFQKLLLRCANEPRTVYVGDAPVDLLRGQCVVGRFELAKCFGLKREESSRIRRILTKLEKKAKLITKRRSINCSIVTVINYDSWTSMTTPIAMPTPYQNQTTATNQNAKKKENLNPSYKESIWTATAVKALEELGGVNV